jgi:hypothetical protein
VDGQFEPLQGKVTTLGITLNAISHNEHVPEIERYIRTVKERTWCVYNTLPFKQMPLRIIVEMVYYSIFWLSMFPANNGISNNMSPRSIIAGLKLDYTKHCCFEFDTYVQVNEEQDNSMATQTMGAMALCPTGNSQGRFFFFSLMTGCCLNCNQSTSLPMPAKVFEHVHAVAPHGNGMTFTDQNGQAIANKNDDDNDDESYNPNDDSDNNDNDDNDGDNNDDNHIRDVDDNAITGVYHEQHEQQNNENKNIDGNENEHEPDMEPQDDQPNNNEQGNQQDNQQEVDIGNWQQNSRRNSCTQ